MKNENIFKLYPNELSDKDKSKFYNQEILADQSSIKIYLLLLTFIMVGSDAIGDAWIVPKLAHVPPENSERVNLVFFAGALITYIISFRIQNCQGKRRYLRIRLTLNFIATCLLTLYVISETVEAIEDAIEEGTLMSWNNALEDYSCSISLTMLVSLLMPTWYLRIILPCSSFISMIYAYFRTNHVLRYWILGRLGVNCIIIIILALLQSNVRWKYFIRNLETEGWNQIYQDILSRTPSALGVLSLDGDIIYSNSELKALLADKGKDSKALFKDIVQLKKRDLWMKNLLTVKRDKSHSQPKSSEPLTYRLNILQDDAFTPRELLYPLSFEESFSNIMKQKFQESVLDVEIKKNSPEKNQKNSFEKTSEYDNFLELLQAFKTVFETSHDAIDEKHLTFDGKLFAKTAFTDGRKSNFVSYEVRLCPLYEYKKVILILNNTTERDLIASIEENSQYKDRLLASMSHNLRTPLNGNLTFLQSAIRDSNIHSTVKEKVLRPAIRSGTLLLNLINDILDYSHLQSNEFSLNIEPKSLRSTMNDAYNLLRDIILSKDLGCKLEIDEQIPVKIHTDHHRVTQILLNLLGNALKFTYKGVITVKAKCLDERNIEISVTDTGIGMTEVELEHLKNELINPLVSSTASHKCQGIGLGLKISHELIKKIDPDHESQGLKIESAKGEGSCFSFLLKDLSPVSPILEKIPVFGGSQGNFSQNFDIETLDDVDKKYNKFTEFYSLNKDSWQIAAGSHKSRFTTSPHPISLTDKIDSQTFSKEVLVVDDDPMNILGLELLLKKFNFSVSKAYNGQQAIAKVREKASISGDYCQYRAIFMDCQMPVMDGYQASRTLREMMRIHEIPNIPIIGCTAFTAKNKLDECIASGMDYVITKPVNFEQLNNILNKYV